MQFSIESFPLLVALIPSILFTVAIIRRVVRNELKRPLFLSTLILGTYTLISSIALLIIVNILVALINIIINGVFLGIIGIILKNRDIGGLIYAEDFLGNLQLIDVQIAIILSEISRGLRVDKIREQIHTSLSFILDEIRDLFLRTGRERVEFSILLTKADGHFEVVAQKGLTPNSKDEIERTFRYIDPLHSLAGYAAAKMETITIQDLQTTNDPRAMNWVQLFPDQKKEGSIICWLIEWENIEMNLSKPLAVLCISTHKHDVIDCEVVSQILPYYAIKIEQLLYIYLSHSKERRRTIHTETPQTHTPKTYPPIKKPTRRQSSPPDPFTQQ